MSSCHPNPDILAQVFLRLSSRELRALLQVSRYWNSAVRQAYHARKIELIRVTMLLRDPHSIPRWNNIRKGDVHDIKFDLETCFLPNNLPPSCHLSSTILRCTDHFTVAGSSRLVQKFKPTTENPQYARRLLDPLSESDFLFHAERDTPVPKRVLAIEVSRISPTRHSLRAPTLQTATTLGTPVHRRILSPIGSIFGPDFTLQFTNESTWDYEFPIVQEMNIPWSWLNESSERTGSIYPLAAWHRLLEMCDRNGIHRIEDGIDMGAVRKWLWVGSRGRKGVEEALKGMTKDRVKNLKKIYQFVETRIETKRKQQGIIAHMKLTQTARINLLLKVEGRLAEEFLQLPLAKEWLMSTGLKATSDVRAIYQHLIELSNQAVDGEFVYTDAQRGRNRLIKNIVDLVAAAE